MVIATSLISLGHAETQISGHMDILTEQLNNNYLRLLRDSRECYKEYLEIRRKLEMRRLDYAANLSRLQKAKRRSHSLNNYYNNLESSMRKLKVNYYVKWCNWMNTRYVILSCLEYIVVMMDDDDRNNIVLL